MTYAHRALEFEGTVADGQIRDAGEAATLKIVQQLASALDALKETFGKAQNLFAVPIASRTHCFPSTMRDWR